MRPQPAGPREAVLADAPRQTFRRSSRERGIPCLIAPSSVSPPTTRCSTLTPEQRKAYYDVVNAVVDLINADFYKYAHHVAAATDGALAPNELSRSFVRYKHVPHLWLDEGARHDRGP